MSGSSGKLAGKRVVITGVSRGVGFEIAKLFLAEGAQVLGVARNRANLSRANEKLRVWGKVYSWVLADVSKSDAPLKIVKAVRRKWGALDILINNAGVSPGNVSFLAEKEHDFERTLATNLVAPYKLTRALMPLLNRGISPRVICVSSGAGSFESVSQGREMSSYRLSKYALNGLVMLFANELAGKVSVVAMDPGWVKTDMGGPDAPDSPALSGERALAIALSPPEVTGKYLVGGEVKDWR